APNGNFGMSFIESSPTEFMSMYVTGRSPADPAGTMEAPQLVAAGAGVYTGGRAGDFSGINVDPANNSFWGANEIANATSGRWETRLANFSPDNVRPALTAVTISSATVLEGRGVTA